MNSNKRIYVDGIEKSLLEKCKHRIIAITVLFFVTFFIVNIKLISTSKLFQDKKEVSKNVVKNPTRGNIYDRNGNVFAVSMPTYSLYSRYKNILNPNYVVKNLSEIFPDLTEEKILIKLQSKTGFSKRHLNPKLAKSVKKIGDPGLKLEEELLRLYPYGEEASHIVGFLGKTSNGLAGIERKYNDRLIKGEDVYLTIDSRVQFKLNKILNKGIEKYRYIGAVGIVLEVNTGEVMSAVSLPSFNPNPYSDKYNPDLNPNKITGQTYEMGSIFKSFTIAASLNEKIIDINTIIDATKPLEVNGRIIRDDHPENRHLSVEEVFVYSSNIGIAQIGLLLGKEKQSFYFSQLKLDTVLDTGIPEVQYPLIPSTKRDIELATKSYGHGIAVSPLNVISALATTINGGIYVEPLFVKDDKYYNRPKYKVFKNEVSEKMKKLYRSVVENEGGTAKKIRSEIYFIGGKTGTANKVVNGKYHNSKVISSFISFFPIDNPKYAVFILLDEPKISKNVLGRTAGMNAVPLTKEIIYEIAPILSETRLSMK